MKKYLLIIMLCCANISIHAQNVAEMWINIPDELTPYLTKNDRKEMIECQAIGVETKVVNKFHGNTDIIELADDRGSFSLSEAKEIMLARLPSEQDSIFLYIETLKLPERHSSLRFYDRHWKQLDAGTRFAEVDKDQLFLKPDTMTTERYDELMSQVSLLFVEYTYDSAEKALHIIPHVPFVATEEKEPLNALVSKKILKWNGEIFNECYK